MNQKNKTKKNKKDNDMKKILITLFAVILIIVIIGGATFAYWSWQTSDAQRTNVNVTVQGATFTIEGNNISSEGMYPTANCNGNGALKGEVATMTVVNSTESPMTAGLKIRVSLFPEHGTLSTTAKSKINWAIVDTSTSATCSTPTKSGTFSTVTVADQSSDFPNVDYTDIDTGETFIAYGTTKDGEPVTTTKTYKIFVWLDNEYEYTNYGNVISDPMQGLKISVKWSPASTLVQG